MFPSLAAAAVLAAAASLPSAPVVQVAGLWPDSFLARLAALAQIQQLNADLLSHDSATATLQHWCDTHGNADGAKITAQRVRGQDKPADAQVRAALAAGPDEVLGYRRVRLTCGARVLSEADNWYRPARLTPEMNRLLETTDTPFGVVVKALGYRRHTLSSELLWRPLPPDWETLPRPADFAGATLAIPRELLRHRAVLSTPDGTPFSLVAETYSDEILFRPPGF
jgi:hypothetical protein